MTPEQEARAEKIATEIGTEMEQIAAATMGPPYPVSKLPGWNCLLSAVARAIVRELPQSLSRKE